MQTLPTIPYPTAVVASPDDHTLAFTFALASHDQQKDIAYFDRSHEVHINLALGRLCSVGCRECSATMVGHTVAASARGNLSPEAIGQKMHSIVTYLAPSLHPRSLVVSAMNDGDPLTRSSDDVIETVQQIQRVCSGGRVQLDRVNLSSSLIAARSETIRDLAARYQAVFGAQLVQLQASLLATNLKRNIFAGDGSQLALIAEVLTYYRQAMRAATGRGEVWVNYVAVKCGDFGRSDGPHQLDAVARVAETLCRTAPQVKLKITRGTVDGLDGWEALSDHSYTSFVDAVVARWGRQLAIYSPDRIQSPAIQHRCGRIQR